MREVVRGAVERVLNLSVLLMSRVGTERRIFPIGTHNLLLFAPRDSAYLDRFFETTARVLALIERSDKRAFALVLEQVTTVGFWRSPTLGSYHRHVKLYRVDFAKIDNICRTDGLPLEEFYACLFVRDMCMARAREIRPKMTPPERRAYVADQVDAFAQNLQPYRAILSRILSRAGAGESSPSPKSLAEQLREELRSGESLENAEKERLRHNN